ncbi:hypothetical protein DRN69_03395 [Candidatus Pacearchaeota archaeon]|nr:MAG: hypothetical protein DRN69_03395 [Candidatus Pacearchaeota archaeon]
MLNFSKYSFIIAVFVFGSYARDDKDKDSDLDLCIICENLPFGLLLILREEIAKMLEISQKSIVIYTTSDLEQMSRKGSMFMWHLKLEGKLIYSIPNDKLIDKCFNNLNPYNNADEDLKIYKSLLDDIKVSVIDKEEINEFDLALIFTVARNTCMVLCEYKGVPRFGRKDGFSTLAEFYQDKLPLKKIHI